MGTVRKQRLEYERAAVRSEDGINDGVDQFLEDTVRSATGVKTGPMPTPYPLARVIAGNSADAVHWIQDNFGLALDTVSRLGGHTNQRIDRNLVANFLAWNHISTYAKIRAAR